MSEPTQPSGVLDLASETVVIALELADEELRRSPARIAKALQSADVQKALTKVLEEFARNRVRSTTTTVSEEDARELGKKLLEAGQESVVENVTTQIKNSSKYQELDKSLKALTEGLKQTPMGVWIDEHKAVVYIVGAGAILGGAAAMYVTRTGDPVTKTIMPLVGGKSVSFKLLGRLEVEAGVGKVVFTPSERLIEGQTFVNAKWKQLEVRLNLSATFADGKATAEAKGQIVIPVRKGVTLGAGGGYNSANKDWSLNVTLGVDVKGILQVGVLAGIGKGGVGPVPSGDAFKALPEAPKDSNRPAGFIGLGISGSF